jgi:hypothetical protein
MAHCRYCNRFRLTRLAGRGAWLLDYADLRVMPTSVRSSLWCTESRLMRSA